MLMGRPLRLPVLPICGRYRVSAAAGALPLRAVLRVCAGIRCGKLVEAACADGMKALRYKAEAWLDGPILGVPSTGWLAWTTTLRLASALLGV